MSSVPAMIEAHPIASAVVATVAASTFACGALYAILSRRGRSRPADLPEKMRAVRLVKFVKKDDSKEKNFEVASLPVPVPPAGSVLVRVAHSPINPSDVATLAGTYNAAQQQPLPAQCGFEAAGTVVQSGGGMMAGRLMGKRVGVISTQGGIMWAEYAVVPALQCVVLPSDVSFAEGCSCFVNPLTVIAFMRITKARKAKCLLMTAAASACGRMAVRCAPRYGVEVICVVRREDQAKLLRSEGAKNVLLSTSATFEADLTALCSKLQCTVAFDAVSGDSAGLLLHAMPNGSECFVYGALSGEPVSRVSPKDLIFSAKKLSGFWLSAYLKTQSLLGKKSMLDEVQAHLKTDFRTEVAQSFALEHIEQALKAYESNMSKGKVTFDPTMKPHQL